MDYSGGSSGFSAVRNSRGNSPHCLSVLGCGYVEHQTARVAVLALDGGIRIFPDDLAAVHASGFFEPGRCGVHVIDEKSDVIESFSAFCIPPRIGNSEADHAIRQSDDAIHLANTGETESAFVERCGGFDVVGLERDVSQLTHGILQV